MYITTCSYVNVYMNISYMGMGYTHRTAYIDIYVQQCIYIYVYMTGTLK